MIIKIKNVSVIRKSKYILKNINWEIKKGEHWAILGLNGSGKTTLLNMINGYIYPSEGEVKVLGKNFGEYDLRELRKSIGWVSTALQEKLYGRDNALEIILSGKFASIGLYEEVAEEDLIKAKDILKTLSIFHLSERIYNTLSQGEKQKLLIGRALMGEPELLILDEPATGLDVFAKKELLEVIENLSKKENSPTLIYVTHRTEEILPVFRKILLLRRGEIYSYGNTEDVFTQKVLSDFFETTVITKQINNKYFLEIPSLL